MQAQGINETEALKTIQTLYDMTAPSDMLINPDDLNNRLDEPGLADLQQYAQEVLNRCMADPESYVLKVPRDETVAMHTWGTRGVVGEMEDDSKILAAKQSNLPFVIQRKLPHARFKRSRRNSRSAMQTVIRPHTQANDLMQMGFCDVPTGRVVPTTCDLRLNVFSFYADGTVNVGSGMVTATPPRGGKAGKNGWNMAHGTGHSAERAAYII